MSPIIPQKQCRICQQYFPATSEFFTPRTDNPDKLLCNCRQCSKKKRREYYVAHQEQARAYSRQWAEDNYERVLENVRRWGQENPDKVREYHRKSRTNHREPHLASRRRRYQLHAIERRAEAKDWRKRNPEKLRLQWKARQARKRANGGTHSPEDIRLQFKSQKGLCWWCGKPLDPNNFHVDHRIPLIKGGSNGPRNIVCAHGRCNMSKHDKMPWEWTARLL